MNINLVSIFVPNLVTQQSCIVKTESLTDLEIGQNKVILSFNGGGFVYAFITKKSNLIEIE